MQLVDQPGALADDGLQAHGRLPQAAQSRRYRRRAGGPLADGETRRGAGLDGVGFASTEQRGSVVLVAFGIAAGDGEVATSQGAGGVGEVVQEVQEVVGVQAGDIDADGEGGGGVADGQQLQALAERVVAVGGFDEGQFVGGGRQVVAQEGGVVAVARGVDANADARGGTSCPLRSGFRLE